MWLNLDRRLHLTTTAGGCCTAATAALRASLGRRFGEDDHFSCHFKKEATQPWKIDGPLYTIVWCYNVHKECQICSDQRLIQGTFSRKIMQRKVLTLNIQRRLLSFQLEK